MFRRICAGVCAAVVAAGVAFVAIPQVSAATLTVTSVANAGPGSLREVVEAAAPGDVIVFHPAINGLPIELGTTLLVDKDLTINGNGPSNTIIVNDGGTNMRLEDAQVTIREIQLRNAFQNGVSIQALDAPASVVIENALITGNGSDGIQADASQGTTLSVIVRNSTISENGGEGIDTDASDLGSLTVLVEDSTISGNDDALRVRSGTELTVVRSTLSGNARNGINMRSFSRLSLVNSTVSGNGVNGLLLRDVVAQEDFATIVNSTIVDNGGHGIWDRSDVSGALITNTIVYGNTLGDCGGLGARSGGGNIAGDATCTALTAAGDQLNTDPLLGALAMNGGATQTRLPQTGSPAIDAGLNGPCPGTDQRGEVRPQDGNNDGGVVCDIGAVEVAGSSVTPTTAPATTAPATTAPATTAPATTAPATTAPATTAPATTTPVTTDPASAAPSTTAPALPIVEELPATGDQATTQIWISILLLLAGSALVVSARRRAVS